MSQDGNFWKQGSPKIVAGALLGMSIVCGDREAVVLKTQPFPRSQNTSGIWEPISGMQPGEVYCPRQHNAILLIFVTMDGPVSGGCVVIRAAEIDGVVYDRAKHVTDNLEIIEPRSRGTTEWLDEYTIGLHLSGVPLPKRQTPSSRPIASNGIGEATLQELMPRIVTKFLRAKPDCTFHEFLTGLLAQSEDAGALRRQLR